MKNQDNHTATKMESIANFIAKFHIVKSHFLKDLNKSIRFLTEIVYITDI